VSLVTFFKCGSAFSSKKYAHRISGASVLSGVSFSSFFMPCNDIVTIVNRAKIICFLILFLCKKALFFDKKGDFINDVFEHFQYRHFLLYKGAGMALFQFLDFFVEFFVDFFFV